MAFEIQNYSIKEKLPEWWKDDLFLEPINEYTQALMIEMLGALLSNLGVVQPIQVWKELPEEYNWLHRYYSGDEYLNGRTNTIYSDQPIIAKLPNTKRNCDAIIRLSLLGKTGLLYGKEYIDITIKNGFQELRLKHISSTADIVINTQTQQIYINGAQNNNKVEGHLGKIQATANTLDYDSISITNENKKTEIEFHSSDMVNFDLEIELINPVYVTEQHIRIQTVSAFPIEWVKLYGFYCHKFNNKEGYQYVWEKHYREDSRTVFDKITTQFDFERFYVQVKFQGIGMPLNIGFPQEILPSVSIFALNENLDAWGKIYGLPRRYYRDDISEDEEKYTFPKYYKYPVEQDYWYEQRLTNEYRYDNESINASFLKDTNRTNVAVLESIYPTMDDVWVYTESIVPDEIIDRSTARILPCRVEEIPSNGVSWEYPNAIKQENMISEKMVLEPLNSESVNTYAYQSKELDLTFKMPELPLNIKIKGLELILKAETDIHSEALKIDDRSKWFLPFYYETDGGDKFSRVEEIDINLEDRPWRKGQKDYVIGDKNFLFGQENVTREQVKDTLHFKLGFRNEHDFVKATLLIHTIGVKLYYEVIPDKFSISTEYDHKEIILSDNNNHTISMKVNLKNKGKTKIKDKEVIIVVPPEIELIDNRPSPYFDLDIDESFTMGEGNYPIQLRSKDNITGKYDILIMCDEKVIKDEILIRQGFT